MIANRTYHQSSLYLVHHQRNQVPGNVRNDAHINRNGFHAIA